MAVNWSDAFECDDSLVYNAQTSQLYVADFALACNPHVYLLIFHRRSKFDLN